MSLLPLPTFVGAFPDLASQPLSPTQARAKYSLAVDLDYDKASLTARESVVYPNRTSTDLTSLVFNVTPAQFKAFTLIGATVEGRKVEPSTEGVVMEIPLPEKLTRGKSVTVGLEFQLKVPKRGGRFGVGDGIIALGNWFPIVGVYNDARLLANGRPQGWSRHRYVEVGDAFFTETADYEVTVNTSTPVTIAHTGTLVGKETNRWRIQATGVRDFALAISSRYQTQSRSVDGTVVTAYYLPEHAAAGAQYLEAASQALLRLNRLLVPYPFPSLHLAEVDSQSSIAQGQEYPNLVFISSTVNDLGGGPDSYLAYIVMHEVAHQWFYGLVGNDQVFQPWLDEALAVWFSYHILRLSAPELLPNVWQKRLLDPMADSIRRNGDSPVDKGIYDFGDELHYYNIVYRKGALFVEDLYRTMGETAFFNGMQAYVRTFRDKIATPIAFLDLFQSFTAVDLRPLVAKYFAYSRYRGVEIVNVAVEFPPDPVWSGVVRPKVKSSHPIAELVVFVEEEVVWAGRSSSDMGVDYTALAFNTTTLKDGEEYLLTVKVTSANKTFERSQRFGVRILPQEGPRQEAIETPDASSRPSPASTAIALALSGGSVAGLAPGEPSPWQILLTQGVGRWGLAALTLLLALGIAYTIRRAR